MRSGRAVGTEAGRVPPDTDGCPLLFVLGITRRSGTNYLGNLIYLHPDCDRVYGIWEDFAVAGASLIDDYVRRVSGEWDVDGWGLAPSAKDALWHAMSRSVVGFLLDHRQGLTGPASGRRPERPRWVVARTPSVEGLPYAARFPGTRVIVLVRDGRSVVSSGVKGFGWGFRSAAERWAAAADIVLGARAGGQDFLLVRYEDLLRDLPGQMARVLDYLGLDAARYDLAAAAALPLTGSSFVDAAPRSIHWGKVPRGDTTRLLARFADWTEAMHATFNGVAGAQMERLGYDLVVPRRRHWGFIRWPGWRRRSGGR